MSFYKILYFVLLFLKLCGIRTFELNGKICHLENNHIGTCVLTSICPKVLSKSQDFVQLVTACQAGEKCCMMSAKIMTPTNSNSMPSFPPIFQYLSTTGSPQWVSVTPLVVNPTLNAGSVSNSNGTTSNGNIPASGSFSPSGGSIPPNGSSPPSFLAGSGQPAAGGSPPTGAPLGGTPPNGVTTPSVSPPALVGNIVAETGLPSKSLPPPESFPLGSIDKSDTIVVSAEVVDNAINIFDRKCELYHSMTHKEPSFVPNQESLTPVVMIYGGIDSEEKEFPHMAALGYGEPSSKQWLCGGSLITENFVVTAAHCLLARPLGEVRYVKLGSLRLDRDTQNTQMFDIIQRISHEQYDPRTHYNDIALLQLDQGVHITTYVSPICLFSSTNYEDRNLIATGWGKTETGSSALALQKVGLEGFTQTECQNAYKMVPRQQLPLGIQEPIQMCAGSHSLRKDTCQGDSGGPLQIRKNNRWYLIGITSIGLQCGVANTPGVYTRVAYYIQWIQQRVWNK